MCFKAGGPNLFRNRANQQEVSGEQATEASSAAPHHSHYSLNYPLTAALDMEKLSSTKLVARVKNVGDCCFKGLCLQFCGTL